MLRDEVVVDFSEYKKSHSIKTSYLDVPIKAHEYNFPMFIPFVGWVNYTYKWELY